MVSAIVYDADKALREGIALGGSALAQGLAASRQRQQEQQMRQQEMMQRQQQAAQQGSVLQQTLGALGPGASEQEYLSAFGEAIQAGVPVEQLNLYQKILGPQQKARAQQEQFQNLLSMLGVAPIQQRGREIDISTMSTEEPKVEGAPSRIGEVSPGFGLQNLSDTQLVAMSASTIPGASDLASAEMKRRDMERKEYREDRDFEYKRAGKFLEGIDNQRRSIRDQEESLYLMEDALASQDLSFFSPDNVANFLGKYGDALRSAKGAQFNTALKEFLVSDIGRVGSRPNQWIEQQISTALSKIGRSREANESVVAALKARIERDRKRIELTDEIEERYRKESGIVPGNLASIVDNEMKPYEQSISDKLAYTLRNQFESENRSELKALSNKKVPRGTPLTVEMATVFIEKYRDPKKARENAEKMGYKIPTAEEYERYVR